MRKGRREDGHIQCPVAPGFGGRVQQLPPITAKAEKRQKFPLFFSDVYLLICQELFSVNSEKLLKNQSKAKPAVHNNHYAHLHSFHILLPAESSCFPSPFQLRNQREGYRGKIIVYSNGFDKTHTHRRTHTRTRVRAYTHCGI